MAPASPDLDYDRFIVGAGSQALVTRVGERLCALPIEIVEETMRRLPVEPLPDMPPFVLGVAVIRGRPTPVVDGGALVGVTPGPLGRFVTLRVGDRRVALAVDEVIDVRSLPTSTVLPPLVTTEIASALATLDRELVIVLDAARVLDKLEAVTP